MAKLLNADGGGSTYDQRRSQSTLLSRSGSSLRRKQKTIQNYHQSQRPFSDGITLDDEAPALPEKVSQVMAIEIPTVCPKLFGL